MSPTSPIDEAKRVLRASARVARQKLTEIQRREANREIASQFIGNIPLNRGDVIAGFWPMAEEPDIQLLLEALDEEGYRVCLPVIEGKRQPLLFRRWQKGDVLQTVKDLQVRQPLPEKKECRPSIAMVPLLAFDARGNRLGYGGGYYDRTLQLLREEKVDMMAVGIAYACQQVKKVPGEAFDQRLDCVVTEKNVVVCTTD